MTFLISITLDQFHMFLNTIWKVNVAQSCLTLCDPVDCIGKNTGVRCHSFLQGILPTQGSNLGLPLCRWILYQLSHQGSLLGPIWMGIISYIVFQHNSVLFFSSSWWEGLCNTRSIQSSSCFFLLHTISSQTPASHPQGETKFSFWWFRQDHKIFV